MRPRWAPRPAIIHIFLLLSPVIATGDDGRANFTKRIDDYDDVYDLNKTLDSSMVYDRLLNVTDGMPDSVHKKLDFCITDMKKEISSVFNFSSDLKFIEKCFEETDGDLTERLCTEAELILYFNRFFEAGNNFRPNRNCNVTSWASGCEPGWACKIDNILNVNLKETTIVPARTQSCRPCCEGFFCPNGLTCMIPCPLGAYCPVATFDNTAGVCQPYSYHLPPGQPNHTCGGADMWADVRSSDGIFCPAGYYCPSTIEKISCSEGHYCRKGSTFQEKCFQKSSCKPNSTNQDLTLFGALLMVALSLVLLFIYTFSGQFLTRIRRRKAKSREAAATTVRETTKAYERWQSAKNAAKKHAVGLQSKLSRTFSHSRSKNQSDLTGAPIQANSPFPGVSALETSKTSTLEDTEPCNLTMAMESVEENRDDDEGFNLETGDEKIKNSMPNRNRIRRHSQIFRYAFGQIEKEKTLHQKNKSLTFSGVLSLAPGSDITSRPLLELSFKDLTIRLKGTKKHILRSVTGKLLPGHVAALMGPSGAGKTTFLNALSGKARGCETSGAVLINGKKNSIYAYKKIIGFVPQDDIVHGNLTVEENLWFSAKCRLSADMSEADKVLVVERVIDSLGLQPIRDSIVGTVEKRGISGGQRKRVNVGLEMVMEPSLLLLDEPTSGLDSSSSNLLLRALRREALQGVNICMVVHQPSYALFKMFDDLILLAKGGLTVYHGSVKKVEEYFAGLGITIPDRVNPPDYFIDILEGIITLPGVEVKQLPIKWMLHKGYDVPPDVLELIGTEDTTVKDGDNITQAGTVGPSVSDEASSHTKNNKFLLKFSKFKDLSNRRTPGILQQYKYYLGRVVKQRLREATIQGVDYLILGFAGVCLGRLAQVKDETFGVVGYTYTVIAVSLLCKIGALRSFSSEKLQFSRERASGMSSLAYFLSKDTIDHFNTIVKPIVYLLMFYFSNNPRSSIIDNYIVLTSLVYCVTGIGYALAIFFQPGSAQLWSALLPVVLTLLATQHNNSKWLKGFCYTKWALEAFVISNAKRYSGVWLITRCGSLMKYDYNISDWTLCIEMLVLCGIAFRIIAFLSIVTLNRK